MSLVVGATELFDNQSLESSVADQLDVAGEEPIGAVQSVVGERNDIRTATVRGRPAPILDIRPSTGSISSRCGE